MGGEDLEDILAKFNNHVIDTKGILLELGYEDCERISCPWWQEFGLSSVKSPLCLTSFPTWTREYAFLSFFLPRVTLVSTLL